MKISDISVELVDYMGNDNSVVNAARVSFSKLANQFTKEQNDKLITYLASHNHWSPFAHAFASLRIKAPIFVARQLVKHQVGLAWNEVSRRYVDEEPECYLPETLRYRPDNSIKQGSSDKIVPLVTEHGRHPYMDLSYACEIAFQTYNNLLNDGVAPEQARMILPQNTMTEWIWSGSLAAFVRVCKLRLDPHAQLETQMVAQQIRNIIEPLFPVSFKALLEN